CTAGRTRAAATSTAGAWTDADRHAGVQIVARGVSVLRLAVDDVRMIDVDAGVEAVATTDAVPIHVGDAATAALRARTAPTVVVLEAGVDVIRMLIVSGDDVRQSRCHRRDEIPRAALGVAHIEAAVVADHEMIRVLRIDPDRVLIDVRGLAVAAGI